MAPAVLAPQMVDGLALLAAPWDFHADNAGPRAALDLMRPIIEVVIGAQGEAPVDLLQLLFASLDPTLVGRKFRRFASLDPASDEANRFVALEDWLNDGVPLVAGVARQVLFSWYGENAPMRGAWAVAGTTIDPTRITCPTLALIPSQDRIVPPDSAVPLTAAIHGAMTRSVPLGHIGMIAGGGAVRRVYAPLIDWLKKPERQL